MSKVVYNSLDTGWLFEASALDVPGGRLTASAKRLRQKKQSGSTDMPLMWRV